MANEAIDIHHIIDDCTDLEECKRLAKAWMDSAVMFHRNETYYRDLLTEIGEAIGPRAYIQNDGGHCDSVLRAKLPELVRSIVKGRAKFWGAFNKT